MDILWDYNELYGFIWGTNRKTNTISKQMIQLDHRLESEQDGPRSTSAWWLTYPSEKKYDFVSWDDYSQYMEK